LHELKKDEREDHDLDGRLQQWPQKAKDGASVAGRHIALEPLPIEESQSLHRHKF
jgi:hypothetical protein